MKIVIYGRPISKKNSKQLIPCRGRMIMISSKAYHQFRKDALKQIVDHIQIAPPYSVKYHFEMKGKFSTDIDNMIAGINDILQEAGAITDDKYITNITATKISGCDEWLSEIIIN